MPNGHYPGPSFRQKRLQEAAKLLIYLCNRLGIPIQDGVIDASLDNYCKDEFPAAELNDTLSRMTPNEIDTYVYNAREPMSRKLADWWEEQQTVELTRQVRAKKLLDEANLRAKLLHTLTTEELKALGVKLSHKEEEDCGR